MAHTDSAPAQSSDDHDNYMPHRRRQLFPTIDEDDDDLGHISPLTSSTPPNSPYQSLLHNSDFINSSIADYVILENICHNKNDDHPSGTIGENAFEIRTPLSNRSSYLENEVSMSPLYLSPADSRFSTVPLLSDSKQQSAGDDTPSNKSLIQTLKTPQDSYSVNTDIPKLVRKFAYESTTNVEYGKRKIPFSESPSAVKLPKLDPASKVRTALFPRQEESLSPISANAYLGCLSRSSANTKRNTSKSSALFICNRKSKRRFGEINAGVRHKIRKPKPKKLSRLNIAKAVYGTIKKMPLATSSSKQLDDALVPSHSARQEHDTLINSEIDKMLDDKMTSRKRQLSPSPDPNKKFFRFKRSDATVTLDKHVKFKVNQGKFSLLETKQASKRRATQQKLNLDVSDLAVPDDESLIASDKIDEILSTLEDSDKENYPTVCVNPQIQECAEQHVLKAYNSVSMSENSIHLHVSCDNHRNNKQADETSILLSPTSQMCSMTSGLALNSPKKARQNITNMLTDDSNTTCAFSSALDMEQKKLFPIFYGAQNTPPKNFKASKSTAHTKKYKLLSNNQMLLDAGQKRFGATECSECKFIYHIGDSKDELMHLNYHNARSTLRFNGWKEERVVAQFQHARIIKILASDPKQWMKKVKDLLEVVNRDLGYYEMPLVLPVDYQIYLYVKSRTIIGCLVAESQTTGYRMLSENNQIDLCSEKSYPIKCGINRIWVSQAHRKQGVGTSLLNCLRGNFMFGRILSSDDIALSSPTEAGKTFARKYFNTPNFLVYM